MARRSQDPKSQDTVPIYWVLVKEFNVSFHNEDLYQIVWFPYYDDLN